jgi:hypothetical protein
MLMEAHWFKVPPAKKSRKSAEQHRGGIPPGSLKEYHGPHSIASSTTCNWTARPWVHDSTCNQTSDKVQFRGSFAPFQNCEILTSIILFLASEAWLASYLQVTYPPATTSNPPDLASYGRRRELTWPYQWNHDPFLMKFCCDKEYTEVKQRKRQTSMVAPWRSLESRRRVGDPSYSKLSQALNRI